MIELLLTVVFVLLGSQLIQGAYLQAANVYGRYNHTISMIEWSRNALASEKIATLDPEWQSGELVGVLNSNSKDIAVSINSSSLTTPRLYSITATAKWNEGNKPTTYQAEEYVFQKPKP